MHQPPGGSPRMPETIRPDTIRAAARAAAVTIPAEETLDAGTRGFFARCREKIGFVPNVFRAYTIRAERFRKYQAYRNDLMNAPSGLSEVEREMVAVTVSSANRCHYCVVAHGAVLRQLSGDARLGDTIAVNYRGADLPDRLRAMLDFAWKLPPDPRQEERAGGKEW